MTPPTAESLDPVHILRARVEALEAERLDLLGDLEDAYERLGLAVNQARQESEVLYREVTERTTRLERRAESLVTLAAATRGLNATLDLDTLFDTLADQALALAPEVHSVALYVAGDTGGLQLRAARGVLPSAATAMLERLTHGQIAQLSAREKPMIVYDLDRPGPWGALRADDATGSAVVLTLKPREASAALLYLGSTQADAFDAEHEPLLHAFGQHAAAALANAQTYTRMEKMLAGVLMSLASALEAKDAYTDGHSARVAGYAVRIGQEMRLSDDDLQQLHYAALIHDIGKIGIGAEILHKCGALSDGEWEKMRIHPLLGASIIGSIGTLAGAVPGVRSHHERWDGSGYPDGLAGETIPLMARVLSLADAYDSLTTDRAYRPAAAPEAALQELRRGAGTQFDPTVVEAMARCFAEIASPQTGRNAA